MKIRYWGVRGSIPVPGNQTIVYGGNTSCVSVEIDDFVFIFDAGTGIRECGNYLLSKGKHVQGAIFISHTHWDHIQGFPFFVPSYIPGNSFALYGPPSDIQNLSLRQIMELQTRYEYFPVRISQLGATLEYFDCKEGNVNIDGFEVHSCRLNHPVACLAYKLVHNGKIFIYGGDHEPYYNVYRTAPHDSMDEDILEELDENAAQQNLKIVDFCKNADFVSWDAQYSEEEYQSKKGWGHSTYEANIDLAENASIRHILFTHHDPLNSDAILAEREKKYKTAAQKRGVHLDFAREGTEYTLS